MGTSRDPNGGDVCLFSEVTCKSQCKLRSLRANARLSDNGLKESTFLFPFLIYMLCCYCAGDALELFLPECELTRNWMCSRGALPVFARTESYS